MMLHMEFLFILMNVIFVAVAKEPSCPACSRYDFEEKLLERVLRNELVIETMLKEIREPNVIVESALNLMKDDRKKLEGIIEALDKYKDDMESKLDKSISSGMTNISETVSDLTHDASMTISQITMENAILKDQLSIPTRTYTSSLLSFRTRRCLHRRTGQRYSRL
ncbi:hypothetical protein DPMN_143349 [Dreissena polymorpha]|uniref:Uncharacterized protein n=1 Tax=Dreissena polymorpha TaxID=45954 RepID=A0A9D4JJL4_DREPO|nr:hypothetical protein DPMN_143349 [Dreissena polymorpha]